MIRVYGSTSLVKVSFIKARLLKRDSRVYVFRKVFTENFTDSVIQKPLVAYSKQLQVGQNATLMPRSSRSLALGCSWGNGGKTLRGALSKALPNERIFIMNMFIWIWVKLFSCETFCRFKFRIQFRSQFRSSIESRWLMAAFGLCTAKSVVELPVWTVRLFCLKSKATNIGCQRSSKLLQLLDKIWCFISKKRKLPYNCLRL